MRCMTRMPVLTRHRWAGRTVPNMVTGNAWGCFVSVYMNDENEVYQDASRVLSHHFCRVVLARELTSAYQPDEPELLPTGSGRVQVAGQPAGCYSCKVIHVNTTIAVGIAGNRCGAICD